MFDKIKIIRLHNEKFLLCNNNLIKISDISGYKTSNYRWSQEERVTLHIITNNSEVSFFDIESSVDKNTLLLNFIEYINEQSKKEI